jgi:hypothetical protein
MEQRKITAFLVILSVPILALTAIAAPKIVFDTESLEQGKVLYGTKAASTFHFTNAGDRELVIEKVRSSCGCTKAITESKKIPPKSKGVVKAVFDTQGQRAGTKRSTIFVHSNDPDRPVVKLKILSRVVRELSLDKPLLVKKLPSFSPDVTFRVRISNSSKTETVVKGVDMKGSSVTAMLDPTEITVPPGKTVPFAIVLKLKKEPGRYIYAGTVLLKTNHMLEKIIRLRYFIQVGQRSSLPADKRAAFLSLPIR